jgi:hypothetical protein
VRLVLASLVSFTLVATIIAVTAPPHAAAQGEPNPRIVVYPAYASIGGWDFPAGVPVTITKHGERLDDGSFTVKGDGSFWFGTESIGADDEITVEAGGLAETTVVTHLTVDAVSGNVVTGKASGPIVHFWVNDTDVDRQLDTVAGTPDRAWSVDVGVGGPNLAVTDLHAGMGGTVEEDDGNGTAIEWNVPDPKIFAEINQDSIWGQDLGWPVTISVHDPISGVTGTWTAAEIEHEPGSTSFQLNLGPRNTDHPWDLLPGQTVTVAGTSTRSLVIANLAITGYDLAAETVSGSADPSNPIFIDITRKSLGDDPAVSLRVDGASTWTATVPFDLQLLDEARAKQVEPGGDGDETWFSRRLAPPRFAFAAELQEVSGFDWPTGAKVKLTVVGPGTPANPDFSAEKTVGLEELPETFLPSAGGEPNVWFDLTTGAYRAKAGDTITMTDGTTTKTQVIPPLTVNLPAGLNTMTGTTGVPMPDGSFLWALPGVTPNADGSWEYVSGEELARPGVWAIQIESDGDQTAVSEPFPRVWVDPQADRVWAIDFEGSKVALEDPKVTLTVTHAGTADQVREATVQNIFYGGWEPVDMWAKPTGNQERPLVALFDLKGDIDLQAGDTLAVTDGVSDADHGVGLCSVDTIDTATDTMTGQATSGTEVGVHIGADRGGFWYDSVTAVDGHWTFHFDPAEFPNQGLDPGMVGQAFCDPYGSIVLWSIPSGTATSTTIKTDTPDPTVVGQAYSVGVAVRRTGAGTGRPLGTVTIGDGHGASCTDTTSAKADARTSSFSCSLRSTAAGAMTLTAMFNPAAGWAGSVGTATHRVNRAATITEITNAVKLATTPTKAGERYAVAVKVTVGRPGAGTPTGTVVVSDGLTTCEVAALSATGTGSCTLVSTRTGVRTITARFPGTANFGPSSATAVHRVR